MVFQVVANMRFYMCAHTYVSLYVMSMRGTFVKSFVAVFLNIPSLIPFAKKSYLNERLETATHEKATKKVQNNKTKDSKLTLSSQLNNNWHFNSYLMAI